MDACESRNEDKKLALMARSSKGLAAPILSASSHLYWSIICNASVPVCTRCLMLDFLARMMVTVPLEPVRSNTIFPDKKYLPVKKFCEVHNE